MLLLLRNPIMKYQIRAIVISTQKVKTAKISLFSQGRSSSPRVVPVIAGSAKLRLVEKDNNLDG